MDANEFRRIITAFADSPTDFDVTRGEFVLQLRDDVITGKLLHRRGELLVDEGGEEVPAVKWIIHRVARLRVLAQRILMHVADEPNFVTPRGYLLDILETSPTEEISETPDALAGARHVLDRRPGGTTTVLYLTSDAGEGKTTLINRLAREQAQSYLDKATDWLLLPISLGGRTLLRFDDVIIGCLVNRLRFQLWYYDAIVELVRMGIIVPAFDGFEEMFIESATGEAVSALSNLVRELQSSGSMLIAARKAYFEYKSFDTQARLFDAIESVSVEFARIAVRRWDKQQFIQYCQLRSVSDADEIYSDVASRLGADHPLLTRAVLAARLVGVSESVEDRRTLLEQLGHTPHEFYAQFVRALITREAREKWINREGQPAEPLLTEEEHYHLLSLIAQEMWISSSNILGQDLIDLLSDMFSEDTKKDVVTARQVKERIKQHALIVRPEPAKPAYSFDHEEFQAFFLGWGLAHTLHTGSVADIRRLIEPRPLPAQTMDTAGHFARKAPSSVGPMLRTLQAACGVENPSSFARENSGGIGIRILDRCESGDPHELTGLIFPPEALCGRVLTNITFRRCQFQPTSLVDTNLTATRFVECTFERVELNGGQLNDVELNRCEIRSVTPPYLDHAVFDPNEIQLLLQEHGFSRPEGRVSTSYPPRHDEFLEAAERLFRSFLRATELNESVVRLKLGRHATPVLQSLLAAGILREVAYKGGGRQKRFRLVTEMRGIERALRSCDGTFEDLFRKFEC